MQTLYPILLQPEYVERVWGARDLSPFYQVPAANAPIGEVWLTGDHCRVRNGALAGKMLAELAEEFGDQLTGSAPPNPSRFPLLLKVLFPREKLSVQVHPDDLMASAAGEDCGKTECWYILCADPGARVALGVKPGTTAEGLKQAIRENTLENLLQWLTVQPGELIYIAAGTIHAIGPGSILLETQQNSDTTYRLYDYGRPRELHIEKGLAAVNFSSCAGRIAPQEHEGHRNLVESPCFVVRHFVTAESVRMSTIPDQGSSSPHCIFVVNGTIVVDVAGQSPLEIRRGETVLIPAALGKYAVRSGSNRPFEIVCAQLPALKTGHPHSRIIPYEENVAVR